MRTTGLIIAAALAVSGCSVSRDKASAEAGVARFHEMLDAGRYHDIFSGAAAEFRQAGPEQEGVRVLQRVHDLLGAFRSSRETSWRVNLGSAGNIVNLHYDSQFASAAGTEDFVFRVTGDAAQLVGFHVNSPALNGSAAPAPSAAAKPGEAPESEVQPAQPSSGK